MDSVSSKGLQINNFSLQDQNQNHCVIEIKLDDENNIPPPNNISKKDSSQQSTSSQNDNNSGSPQLDSKQKQVTILDIPPKEVNQLQQSQKFVQKRVGIKEKNIEMQKYPVNQQQQQKEEQQEIQQKKQSVHVAIDIEDLGIPPEIAKKSRNALSELFSKLKPDASFEEVNNELNKMLDIKQDNSGQIRAAMVAQMIYGTAGSAFSWGLLGTIIAALTGPLGVAAYPVGMLLTGTANGVLSYLLEAIGEKLGVKITAPADAQARPWIVATAILGVFGGQALVRRMTGLSPLLATFVGDTLNQTVGKGMAHSALLGCIVQVAVDLLAVVYNRYSPLTKTKEISQQVKQNSDGQKKSQQIFDDKLRDMNIQDLETQYSETFKNMTLLDVENKILTAQGDELKLFQSYKAVLEAEQRLQASEQMLDTLLFVEMYTSEDGGARQGRINTLKTNPSLTADEKQELIILNQLVNNPDLCEKIRNSLQQSAFMLRPLHTDKLNKTDHTFATIGTAGLYALVFYAAGSGQSGVSDKEVKDHALEAFSAAMFAWSSIKSFGVVDKIKKLC